MKEFVYVMAIPNGKVDWSGETEERLVNVRFPQGNLRHEEVKEFCAKAKQGDFMLTDYALIFCSRCSVEMQIKVDDGISGALTEAIKSVGDIPIPKKKVYIAGKITGLDIFDASQNFNLAEHKLRKAGFEPINPMKKVGEQEGKSWAEYMSEDMLYLLNCDAIYLLSNWRDSKGARVEHAVAKEIGLEIILESLADASTDTAKLSNKKYSYNKGVFDRAKPFPF